MCPVLLFDVGVIIFLVWSRAGEGEIDISPPFLGEVLDKVVIEKLASVITVKTS